MYPEPLAFVDLETTGTHPAHDRVIEVGVVLLDPDGTVREWNRLVDPGASVPPFIQKLTGITDAMLADAPPFSQVADELEGLLEGRVFVAHNARFDYGFLREEFARLGRRFQRRPLCTVKLSRKLFPGHARHNLDSVIARCGLAVGERHRALGDARALLAFFQHLYATRPAEEIAAAAAVAMQRPSLPPGLPRERVDAIPETPGVYRFLGEGGTVLYVGKSVNLRSRVLGHFSASQSRADRELAPMVRDVDWTGTAGELGALLLETREVKRVQPVLNRYLRRARTLYTIAPPALSAPDTPLQVIELDDTAQPETRDLFGIYRQRRDLRRALTELADSHALCLRALGLEKGRGPCFAHQLGRCKGVCAGIETPAAHTLRLLTALAPMRIQPWPLAGPAVVMESRTGEDCGDLHLIYRWRHLATVHEIEALDTVEIPEALAFDVDEYRILQRWYADGRLKLRPLAAVHGFQATATR